MDAVRSWRAVGKAILGWKSKGVVAFRRPRQRILSHIGLAANCLKERGAQKVQLHMAPCFYLAQQRTFREIVFRSTVLPLEKWAEALLAIEDIEELSPFTIDLKGVDELSAFLC